MNIQNILVAKHNKIVVEVEGKLYYQDEKLKRTLVSTADIEEATNLLANEELKEAKSLKKQELKTKFNEVSLEPVKVNNISFHGGYDSATKLDAKRRMSVEAGVSEVEYFDVDDNFHTFTINEALQIVLTVANTYETYLKHYKTKCKEVDSKLKVSTVESVTW